MVGLLVDDPLEQGAGDRRHRLLNQPRHEEVLDEPAHLVVGEPAQPGPADPHGLGACTRRRCSGTPSHCPTRSPTRAAASRSRAISSVRKFSVTNSWRLRPISFLRLGMIAVCGIGSPSGCRNSAVTANQSASAPTIAASAAVLT